VNSNVTAAIRPTTLNWIRCSRFITGSIAHPLRD
jgi:hypothetical protein